MACQFSWPEQKEIVMTISKDHTNRTNARHSTGPKTANGKRNSSRNSTKHGFFAKEFLLSDEEKVEFQTLHRTLREQLRPRTALQGIALEEIVCCSWRCKLAARLEAQRLRILLETPQDREVQPKETQDPARMRWYTASRQDLGRAIGILEHVSRDFETGGRVREEWKEPLDKAFGGGFYESLTKWTSMSIDAILIADHLAKHAKTFGKPLPYPDDKELAKVVVDPSQSIQMAGKLIDERLCHLRDLHRSWEQRASESGAAQAASPVDFAPRYFTTTTRDQHRAVQWYVSLKKNNL
jgi:hypothetical protein